MTAADVPLFKLIALIPQDCQKSNVPAKVVAFPFFFAPAKNPYSNIYPGYTVASGPILLVKFFKWLSFLKNVKHIVFFFLDILHIVSKMGSYEKSERQFENHFWMKAD